MWTNGKDRKFRIHKYFEKMETNIYAAPMHGVNETVEQVL